MVVDRDTNHKSNEPFSKKQTRLQDLELDFYDPLAEIDESLDEDDDQQMFAANDNEYVKSIALKKQMDPFLINLT